MSPIRPLGTGSGDFSEANQPTLQFLVDSTNERHRREPLATS